MPYRARDQHAHKRTSTKIDPCGAGCSAAAVSTPLSSSTPSSDGNSAGEVTSADIVPQEDRKLDWKTERPGWPADRSVARLPAGTRASWLVGWPPLPWMGARTWHTWRPLVGWLHHTDTAILVFVIHGTKWYLIQGRVFSKWHRVRVGWRL